MVETSPVRLTFVAEDSDGSISSSLWTQKSGPSVTFDSVVNPSLDFIAPEVSNDEEITVELLVTDNDGGVASSGPITITVKQSLADFVIPPFLTGTLRRAYAASSNHRGGTPPIAVFGLSLL